MIKLVLMLSLLLFGLFFILVSIFFYTSRKKWWIKIDTQSPCCIYYFGPFISQVEARSYQDGYLQDLYEEGAQGITIEIEKVYPKQLTIFEEETPAVSI